MFGLPDYATEGPAAQAKLMPVTIITCNIYRDGSESERKIKLPNNLQTHMLFFGVEYGLHFYYRTAFFCRHFGSLYVLISLCTARPFRTTRKQSPESKPSAPQAEQVAPNTTIPSMYSSNIDSSTI